MIWIMHQSLKELACWSKLWPDPSWAQWCRHRGFPPHCLLLEPPRTRRMMMMFVMMMTMTKMTCWLFATWASKNWAQIRQSTFGNKLDNEKNLWNIEQNNNKSGRKQIDDHDFVILVMVILWWWSETKVGWLSWLWWWWWWFRWLWSEPWEYWAGRRREWLEAGK